MRPMGAAPAHALAEPTWPAEPPASVHAPTRWRLGPLQVQIALDRLTPDAPPAAPATPLPSQVALSARWAATQRRGMPWLAPWHLSVTGEPGDRTWTWQTFASHGNWSERTGLGTVELDTWIWSLDTTEASMAVLWSWVVGRGGLLLHGASFDLDGAGVVVVGQSGAGKSTLCGRLPQDWCNEEYAWLVPGPGGWEVWHLLAFRARKGACVRTSPLQAVWVLSANRSETTGRPLSTADATAGLVANAILPQSGTAFGICCDNAALLAQTGRVGTLSHSLATPADVLRAILATAPSKG